MRLLAITLAAVSFVTFTFDIAAAKYMDNPYTYYDASGKRHNGRIHPMQGNNPTVKNAIGKKQK